MKVLAVTACHFGMAQTYMAAEMIQQACERAGIECKVETQGTLGIENEISKDDVASADVVILTTNMPIKNLGRFDNIKKIMVNISSILGDADDIIENIISIK